MAEYPDTTKIRARLAMCKVPDSFVDVAYNVCDDADKNREGLTWKDPRALLDLEFQAQLRFIERVLNGEDRR